MTSVFPSSSSVTFGPATWDGDGHHHPGAEGPLSSPTAHAIGFDLLLPLFSELLQWGRSRGHHKGYVRSSPKAVITEGPPVDTRMGAGNHTHRCESERYTLGLLFNFPEKKGLEGSGSGDNTGRHRFQNGSLVGVGVGWGGSPVSCASVTAPSPSRRPFCKPFPAAGRLLALTF